MNYEIRAMAPDDAQRVLDIFKQGIDGGNATFDTEVPSWEVWDSKFLNICRFVLEDEQGEIVGWAALQPISRRASFSGVAEVSIYLDEAVQGRGLGQMMLKKIILDSEEHGFWTLQSGIFPENKASIAAHSKLGFREVGVREKFGVMNGIWRDVLLMEKRSQVVGMS